LPEPSDDDATSGHGLMRGRGFYNRHGWVQAAGIAAALPALERAAGVVPVEPPIVVADYGSSQGRNSLRPMRVAIEGLRSRAPATPVTVVHIDQPGNDFTSLFGLLHESPDSYLRLHVETYAAAVGRSFFEPVLPPGSVTLGWSSFAAMWLTRVPAEAAGHVFGLLAPPDVLEQLHAQADQDWRSFLVARASELRRGGRLVVLVAGPTEQQSVGSKPLIQAAAKALQELASDGRLAEAARARAFIPTLPRSVAQLLAPFAHGPFAGLAVEEHEDRLDVADAAWERYREDGNLAALTDAYLGFFQATFQPSLLHSLEPFGSALERQEVAKGLEASMRRALTATPQPCAQIPLHTVVLRRI
jgi:salicylate 1-O-methyltransferase